jgi:eukaryotic-like serine/threonine-protein kinase
MADPIARLTAALAERYQIHRELGAGGMATVYLAQDLRHHRDVAVKVLRPELAQTLGPERFLREIEIAAGLHHPHILPLYDSGEADGFLFYVMPFEEGRSLRDRLTRQGELPIPEAVRILRDLVDALAYAHQHGVVHRDVKPENILLSGHHALVTDFGVAKAVSEATGRYQLTTTGVALGTPAYMAPEQAAADPHLDQRADIYAVGIVAYELLTGRPPFTGPTPQAVLVSHMMEQPEPVTALRPAIPPPLAALVMKCLEKSRADRWQSADELLPHLEAMLTPSGGITPVDTRPVLTLRRLRGRWTIPAVAVAVVALAALAGVTLRRESAPALDSSLLAVAPFDVLSSDRDLAVWGEGMMDLLSRSLDGAGPIRTLAPSVAVRRWSGRADATSAEAFGRRTGAGLAVFGTLVAIGDDSARAAATLLDVSTGAVMAEQEVRDRVDRVDRLADSLAVRLLSDLSRTRSVGATPLRSVGSASPAAIKAFLRGQQHYRRSSWDSAKAYFEQAVALDSTFALAHRGIGGAAGWNEAMLGTEALRALEIRAGDLNRGLAPRESLLVLADSLWAGLTPDFDGQWSRLDRLFGILETATRRYPEDPEMWYELGESRFHFGSSAGVTVEEVQAAFDRAIQLDPGFTPAYIHMAELAFMMEGRAAGERALDGVMAAHPVGAQGKGSLLARRLVDPAAAQSPEVAAMLDTLSPEAFRNAFDALMRFPDSAESAIRVARAWAARASNGAAYLRWILAFRGHLTASAAEFAPSRWREPEFRYWGTHSTYAQLVVLGAFPEDSVRAVYADWLAHDYGPGIYLANSWWADRRDTLSLARAVSLYAGRLRLRSEAAAADAALWEWARDCAETYLTLARGDTAAALGRFAALRDWPTVPRPYQQRLTHAELLAARGQDREAAAVLDRMADVGTTPGPLEVTWVLERARVNERLGNREKAVRDYSYVMDAWRHADPLLQPFVDEARQGVARLVREPRRD